MSKNCKRCGIQLEDDESICPVCGETNADDIIDNTEIVVDIDIVNDKLSEKKIITNNVVEPISYRDIGNKGQVEIKFSDGSSVCTRKSIAKIIYPTVFLEGGD